jgi:hypothetical protein
VIAAHHGGTGTEVERPEEASPHAIVVMKAPDEAALSTACLFLPEIAT